MARKGGYQIVNLRDTNLTAGTAAAIKDTYKQVSGAYRKRIVVSGLVLAGVAYNDFDAAMSGPDDSGMYTLTGGGMTITITNANKVTVTPIQAA